MPPKTPRFFYKEKKRKRVIFEPPKTPRFFYKENKRKRVILSHRRDRDFFTKRKRGKNRDKELVNSDLPKKLYVSK